jgi:stress response protein SCP2
MSGGDISLAENTKFKKFSRKERRFLLGAVERCAIPEEDMVKHHNRWLRLGEILHPGEYPKHFPKSYAAFQVLRTNATVETLNSKVEKAIELRNFEHAIALLAENPGNLGRRLDHLFRLDTESRAINETAFFAVADKIATPVLLQIYNHFKTRNSIKSRAVFPKGEVAKIQVIDPPKEVLPDDFCAHVSSRIRHLLVSRFSRKEKLEKVFVDQELKNFPVPFSQRSAAKALRTVTRGSKLRLEVSQDTIRFFIWWKNGEHRTDLDLSAVILDSEWAHKSDITYYNLKDFAGHHSGDIVDAPLGASEFIDISLAKLLQSGGRYLVMCVNSYTQQKYCDLPECFAGWMGRQQPNSGEIYEPKTVHNKIDLASNTGFCIPLIIDAKAGTVIWCDLALKHRPRWNNVGNNMLSISKVWQAMADLKRVDLHDLFSMHAEARGQVVETPEEADHVFSIEKGITPFDVDTIVSEYL